MTGKLNGDQKMMIITVGLEMMHLALVGALFPCGIRICS
jgi:hypothetical protein